VKRRRPRWALARRIYHSPLRPLWSWVAPRWTAEEVAEIKRRGAERFDEIAKYID